MTDMPSSSPAGSAALQSSWEHSAASALARLQAVLNALIAPDGCPWDRTQTPQSLCDYVVEESFELVEAIRDHDRTGTVEELGDVLFLLLFISTRLDHPLPGPEGCAPTPASKHMTLAEALEQEAAKMVRRHPHVFGHTEVHDREELLKNWERIKRAEKSGAGTEQKRIFASLPKTLPPLLRAYRIHSKAARTGFTWPDDEGVKAQFRHEWDELEAACAAGNADAVEEEFGDCLFTLVELGRRLGVKSNAALDRANRKFLMRFEKMEELAEARGQSLPNLDLPTLNSLWDEVKKRET